VSFPFVLPVLVLATGCAIQLTRRAAGPGRLRPAAFAAAMLAATIVLPLEPALLDALGLRWGWLNGARAGIIGCLLIPLAVAAVEPAGGAVRRPSRPSDCA
jgi:hypothetical protein